MENHAINIWKDTHVLESLIRKISDKCDVTVVVIVLGIIQPELGK